MGAIVEVPEAVRRKASAVGPEGERWLDELGSIVAGLEAEWGIEAGVAIVGGSGAYVVPAVTAGGADVMLKVSIPDGLEGHSPFATELDTLLLGDGRGYVKVLRSDARRRAMLQERLGRPLGSLGLPVESQIDVITATLSRGWRPLPHGVPLRTGADQAESLDHSIRESWEALGRPCPRATVEVACGYARSRRDAFDPSTAVLIHGDAHPANVLEDPRGVSPAGFKLVDPDGMRSEPAHDLAIPLRDWSDELLASDPVARGLSWCARLADRTGTDRQAIWEWAFVERVSTGLFLIQLGDQRGARLLEVAIAWTGEQP